MTKPFIPEKYQWVILASFGLLVPALILFVRFRLMCPILELKGFGSIPLSGLVNGRDPHLFYRIMHDLTHPLFLFGYAGVLTYLAIRPISSSLSQKSRHLFFCGIVLLHLMCLASYLLAAILPMGDMVSLISRP